MKSKVKPFILVVVGDSASGKTTLLGNLRRMRSLKSYVRIRDMDENGVPVPGREHWRRYRVEQLLADSVADNKKGKSAVMGGWIWPTEILASPYYSPDLNLHFLFFKNIKAEYIRRLKTRVGKRMDRKEYDSCVASFNDRQSLLENQVLGTTKHTVIKTWKLSRVEVVKNTLEVIKKL